MNSQELTSLQGDDSRRSLQGKSLAVLSAPTFT